MENLTIALLLTYALGAGIFVWIIANAIRAEYHRRKLREIEKAIEESRRKYPAAWL